MSGSERGRVELVKHRNHTVRLKRKSRFKCFYDCNFRTGRRCTKEGCEIYVCGNHSEARNFCLNCFKTDLTPTFKDVQTSPEKQARCRICPSRGKVSRTVCDSCKRPVCADHHRKIILCLCHKTEKLQNQLMQSVSWTPSKAPHLEKKTSNEVTSPSPLDTDTDRETAIHESSEGCNNVSRPTQKCTKCRTTTRRNCGYKSCGKPVCGSCSTKRIYCGNYPPKSNSCYPGSVPPNSLMHGRCVLCKKRGKISKSKCTVCQRFVCLTHRNTKIQCLDHEPPQLLKIRNPERVEHPAVVRKPESPARTIIRIKFNFKKKRRT